MDKYEYKIRADEIKELIAQGEYAQAADIADTIDWRRVKSVMMLCTISDLYKVNRRYEDAKNMMLLAYERRPGGRTICYSLCELCIKTEEFVQAVEYYKEFVQGAPKDAGRYILQYKLYEAQDVSLEERISVLEELKKRDYREKWAYELAYLYHRVGLATKCVEECDEMILWFGDGKYVIKAMELKMLHQPLSREQQQKYDHRFDVYTAPAETYPQDPGSRSDYVKDQPYAEPLAYAFTEEQGDMAYEPNLVQSDTLIYEPVRRSLQAGPDEAAAQPEELDIQVKTMDMGQYNTMNLQAELAAGLAEVLEDDPSRQDDITRSIVAPMMETESLDYPELGNEDIDENDVDDGVEKIENTEVFFGETGEIGRVQPETVKEGISQEREKYSRPGKRETVPEISAAREPEHAEVAEIVLPETSPAESAMTESAAAERSTAETVMDQLRMENLVRAEEQARIAQPPKELAGVLSQESDGQISLVMPERETVEKQITGQMSIQDILLEWERMKREGKARHQEEVRQRVLQQTGNMFTEFDASARDGLLEKLESSAAEDEPANGQESFDENAEVVGDFEKYTGTETKTEPMETAETDEVEDIGDIEETEDFEDMAESQQTGRTVETEREEFDAAQKPEEEELEEGAPDEEDTIATADSEGTGEKTSDRTGVVSAEREQVKMRPLTKEEKELYAPYIQSKAAREQLVQAIDSVSMAAYTGNVIVTGDEGMDTATLSKNIVREIQATDSNFTGKVAKVSGQALNKKDIRDTLNQFSNGALIIQKASGMSKETAANLYRELQRDFGIVVVMEDTKKAIGRLLEGAPELGSCFTARMEIQAMSNGALVSFGRQYAKEMEYSIDDLGVLALHTRVEELQTVDHAVNVMEVKGIVDEAIHHANRKTLGHFVDVLLARRYDEEDMIILTEKDFV